MKEWSKRAKLIIPIAVIVLLAILFGILALRGDLSLIQNKDEATAVSELTVRSEGLSLTIGKDGSVSLLSNSGLFTGEWDPDKVDAFLSYFSANYGEEFLFGEGGAASVTVTDDELLAIVVEETEGGGTGGNGGGGGGATPTPTNPPGGGGGTPGPTLPPGGNTKECLFWRVSYCVAFPSASPTPTPAPQGQEVIEAANCAEYLSQQSAATVIGNTVCLEEPQ